MPVIYYHNVIDTIPDRFDERADRVPVMTFRCQMECLCRRLKPTSLPEYLAQLQAGTLAPDAAAITFDDGCYGVYAHAAPILKTLGIPATVFVVTGVAGANGSGILRSDELEIAFRLTTRTSFPAPAMNNATFPLVTKLERLSLLREIKKRLKRLPEERRLKLHQSVLERLGVTQEECANYARSSEKYRTLSWDRLRELHQQGWTIGSHTCSHSTLSQLEQAAVKSELEDSLTAIRNQIGTADVPFAYPNGTLLDIGFTGAQTVFETGYSCGWTTIHPAEAREAWDNRYMLPRVTFRNIAVCS